MNANVNEKTLTTADLVAATKAPVVEPAQDQNRGQAQPAQQAEMERERDAANEEDRLVALFTPDAANDFRSRWNDVQIGFVDDPKQAVKKADELVAQVMTSLAQTFSKERAELEGFINGSDRGSTENLRVALRRYRSFFQRLLSL
jgi:hypothetical protein